MHPFRIVAALLLALVVVGAAAVLPDGATQAQGADTVCPALIGDAATAARQACAGLGAGQVCYGSGEVSASLAGNATFAAPGDTADLAALESLSTTADSSSAGWGVALLDVRLDLPTEAEQSAQLVLFGGAELVNAVEADAEPAPTITLQNTAGYPINLRGGAGTTFPVAGTLDDGATVLADGRSSGGDWYRILAPDGPAWVYQDLISVAEGDPETLQTRAENDLLLGYTAPLQAMTLDAMETPTVCGAGSSGLLITLAGEDQVHIQVNGVDLAFSTASLLFQPVSEAELSIAVLAGETSAARNGQAVTASAGERIQVEYASESGPVVYQAYAFSALQDAPLDLLPASLSCTAGVLPADAEATLYTGPGGDYQELTPTDPEIHYDVTGQRADDEGNLWWRVDMVGFGQGWIAQDAVRTLGVCGEIAQVAAPPVASAAGSQSSGLIPAGQSVWQTEPGLDNTSGTCTQPAVAMCAHLAAIVPNADGSFSWRGQEPQPYPMTPAGDGSFSYSGRNAIGNGNLQMSLTFTSATAWTMTATTVYDNDPGCQHTFYYTATRSW